MAREACFRARDSSPPFPVKHPPLLHIFYVLPPYKLERDGAEKREVSKGLLGAPLPPSPQALGPDLGTSTNVLRWSGGRGRGSSREAYGSG